MARCRKGRTGPPSSYAVVQAPEVRLGPDYVRGLAHGVLLLRRFRNRCVSLGFSLDGLGYLSADGWRLKEFREE